MPNGNGMAREDSIPIEYGIRSRYRVLVPKSAANQLLLPTLLLLFLLVSRNILVANKDARHSWIRRELRKSGLSTRKSHGMDAIKSCTEYGVQ